MSRLLAVAHQTSESPEFVEAVVGTVQGEDEIWLLEDSPLGHQLYVWEKQ